MPAGDLESDQDRVLLMAKLFTIPEEEKNRKMPPIP
jgi:hypothetical protein